MLAKKFYTPFFYFVTQKFFNIIFFVFFHLTFFVIISKKKALFFYFFVKKNKNIGQKMIGQIFAFDSYSVIFMLKAEFSDFFISL